ncbi:hypothetical protein EN786_05650 [Mesorhizobium sp. M4B.F.Ca.ET.143.01.1.1]|nr:hypothetical protein EOA31_06375 [Mesorhizobium sp. M4B.F.Ca.ET.049.02.1.2]TGV27631.1 hypothetical protein EN786_05650 [Mesorhizobium sp. M4B.F.Ca.ET.143.01.1.1]
MAGGPRREGRCRRDRTGNFDGRWWQGAGAGGAGRQASPRLRRDERDRPSRRGRCCHARAGQALRRRRRRRHPGLGAGPGRAVFRGGGDTPRRVGGGLHPAAGPRPIGSAASLAGDAREPVGRRAALPGAVRP